MSLKNQSAFRPREREGTGRAFWTEGTVCYKCILKLLSTGSLGANSGQGGRRGSGRKRWGAQREMAVERQAQLVSGLVSQAEEPLSYGNREPWKD